MYSFRTPSSTVNLGSSSLGSSSRRLPKPAAETDLPALRTAADELSSQAGSEEQYDAQATDALINGVHQYSDIQDYYRLPFIQTKLLPIPDKIFEHASNPRTHSFMTLIPEIERVIICIDNQIFLWDYEQGEQISSYLDQLEVIERVALVKPRPDVFVDDITHLLVVTTVASIFVLGVGVSKIRGSSHKTHVALKLFETDILLHTNLMMTTIEGTIDGRIFMLSLDGNMYEFLYQQKEGWFQGRCRLINHSLRGVGNYLPVFKPATAGVDNVHLAYDRYHNCLYTLTTAGALTVYKIAADLTVQQVHTINSLHTYATARAPGPEASGAAVPKPVRLHVVEPRQYPGGAGRVVTLVAICANATRIYLGLPYLNADMGQLYVITTKLPPSGASILLPPDHGPNWPRRIPTRPSFLRGTHDTVYVGGTVFTAQTDPSRDKDWLFCVAPEPSKLREQPAPAFRPTASGSSAPFAAQGPSSSASASQAPATQPRVWSYVEQAMVFEVTGRAWSVMSIPHPSYPASTALWDNEFVTQVSEPPRRVMVLTNTGIQHFAKVRVIDYLRGAIENYQLDGKTKDIDELQYSVGRDEACAMLLPLAAGHTFLDLFADYTTDLETIRLRGVSPDITTIAKDAFFNYGGKPVMQNKVGGREGEVEVWHSRKYEGLRMYFSRLVRPFWKRKLAKLGPAGAYESEISEDVFAAASKNLSALSDFLKKNAYLFQPAPGAARRLSAAELDAWKEEQNAVSRLQALLIRCIEGISFVQLMNDYRLGALVSQCEPDMQTLITSITFEDFLTTESGVNATRALVNAIVDLLIGQQTGVDTLSDILQQRCGSFCSADDVMLYKARENIRKAAEASDIVERQNLLDESLRSFMKGIRMLPLDKLREICGDYQELTYVKGAIDLPLQCAHVWDAEHLGQEYWYAGLPPKDDRARFWERRRPCYELVLHSLTVFEQKAKDAAAKATEAMQPNNSENLWDDAFRRALSSQDEIFHCVLYDWLIKRDLADMLLDIRPAFLEAHLKRHPLTFRKLDILWKFYVKDSQPLRAAEVLCTLADSTDFPLSLAERLEYLTRAVTNAKSHALSATSRQEAAVDVLKQVEEKLQVAQVQSELYNTFAARLQQNPNKFGWLLRQLSNKLYSITELYNNYARPYEVPEMELLILHVAEYRDVSTAREIWNGLLNDATEGHEARTAADQIEARIVPLGKKFYPSYSAFPLGHITLRLVDFELRSDGAIEPGWVPRILLQCGVPFEETWGALHEIYENEGAPVSELAQLVLADIAELLNDWLQLAKERRGSIDFDFPVERIRTACELYVQQLKGARTEIADKFQSISSAIRREW